MNQFLTHYITNKITPVKQDISNLEQHFSRREALYKALGVPPILFKDKKVLEIGPGGGYNPLVTQSFQLNKYELVEPNQYAIDDIDFIFKKYKIETQNIFIHNSTFEDYSSDEKFDIIICEGMIPGLDNKEEILKKIDVLLDVGGIAILTCIDEVAYFFEILRHYIAFQLIKKEAIFDKKLDILEDAFTSHLNTLKGMSRFKRDWCADNLMGTMHFNYNFSFNECLQFFKDGYTYYGSSPNMFTDYRWYKEIPNDNIEFNNYFINQFAKKRHNLLIYNEIYSERDISKNQELVHLCKKIFLHIEDEVVHKKDSNKNILEVLESISDNISDLGENNIVYNSLLEVKQLIQNKEYEIEIVSNKYHNFQQAFGRGAFYISLIKEFPNASIE